ncbi:MAG: CPBP family glutamic-type intramembrane protease [Candidatus Limnocylindrales bacterium]
MPFADQIGPLVVLAFTGLLVLLRFDAPRFGAAEYDDEEAEGGWRIGARRFTWYLLGFVLAVLIYQLAPRPISELHLGIGENRGGALALGLAFGILGTAVAAGFAWFRYQRFRLPEVRHYPGAIANSVGTALIDEIAFRGAVLGMLLTLGWSDELALVGQILLYGLATRLGAGHRSRWMLLISLFIAAVAGWLTIATGGIGAAILGHAITRFAIFVTTGHAGQVQPPGYEPEEVEQGLLPPEGWRVVRQGDR